MIRWLAIVCLLAAPASAQVFKPKSGAPTTTSAKAKPAAKKTTAKKSAHKTSKKKKSTAASKGRPDDLTPDEAPKVDPDYVKIIDDDE